MKFQIMFAALMLSIATPAFAEGLVPGQKPSNMAATACTEHRTNDKLQVSSDSGSDKEPVVRSNNASAS